MTLKRSHTVIINCAIVGYKYNYSRQFNQLCHWNIEKMLLPSIVIVLS